MLSYTNYQRKFLLNCECERIKSRLKKQTINWNRKKFWVYLFTCSGCYENVFSFLALLLLWIFYTSAEAIIDTHACHCWLSDFYVTFLYISRISTRSLFISIQLSYGSLRKVHKSFPCLLSWFIWSAQAGKLKFMNYTLLRITLKNVIHNILLFVWTRLWTTFPSFEPNPVLSHAVALLSSPLCSAQGVWVGVLKFSLIPLVFWIWDFNISLLNIFVFYIPISVRSFFNFWYRCTVVFLVSKIFTIRVVNRPGPIQ